MSEDATLMMLLYESPDANAGSSIGLNKNVSTKLPLILIAIDVAISAVEAA